MMLEMTLIKLYIFREEVKIFIPSFDIYINFLLDNKPA